VTIPAVVNVGVGYLTRNQINRQFEFITYRDYVGVSTALLVFVALTAPDIICPDRRQRVLPLIFARPLTGLDYAMSKVGALFTILFLFSFLPQAVLFIGQALVSDSALDYTTDHLDVMWKVPIAVVLLALFHSVIGIAIASLSTRRIAAGATFIGLFLVSSIVSGILIGSYEEGVTSTPASLISILELPLHLRDLVFLGHIDPVSALQGVPNAGLYAVLVYVAIVLSACGIIYSRYRWTER
jgi:ABC-2 type transport system permease protein